MDAYALTPDVAANKTAQLVGVATVDLVGFWSPKPFRLGTVTQLEAQLREPVVIQPAASGYGYVLRTPRLSRAKLAVLEAWAAEQEWLHNAWVDVAFDFRFPNMAVRHAVEHFLAVHLRIMRGARGAPLNIGTTRYQVDYRRNRPEVPKPQRTTARKPSRNARTYPKTSSILRVELMLYRSATVAANFGSLAAIMDGDPNAIFQRHFRLQHIKPTVLRRHIKLAEANHARNSILSGRKPSAAAQRHRANLPKHVEGILNRLLYGGRLQPGEYVLKRLDVAVAWADEGYEPRDF